MFDLSFFMVLMSLSMLTKAPKEYICESTAHDGSYSCQPEDFCNDPSVFSVKPNLELADSYDNWIISFNLQCASKADIGLIGSSFFIDPPSVTFGGQIWPLETPLRRHRYGHDCLDNFAELVVLRDADLLHGYPWWYLEYAHRHRHA